MKKFLSFVMVMAILVASVFVMPAAYAEEADASASAAVSVWDGTIPTANSEYTYGGGTGIADDPYLLKSAYDVAMLAANVNSGSDYSYNKTFKLCIDLDMANQAWPGIGNAQTSNSPVRTFKGTFDGDGHVVYNLNLSSEPVTDSSTGTIGRGFFGATFDAAIKNFGIASGKIEMTNNRSVGSIVGRAWRSLTMENCFSGADMVLSYEINRPASSDDNVVYTDEDCWYAGGLIGSTNQNVNGTTLTDCFWYGSIQVKDTTADQHVAIGGIVGMAIDNNLAFDNVTSIGSITIDSVSSQALRVSAFVGCARTQYTISDSASWYTVSFTDCQAGGTVNLTGTNTHTVRVSALAGWNWNMNWTIENTVHNFKCGENAVTQVVGNFTVTGATATTDEIKITSSALFTDCAYQKGNADNEGEYKIRFASELTFSPYAFVKAGYIVTISYVENGATQTANNKELSGNVVYASLYTPSGNVEPEAGKCFVAQGITDIPVETATFTVTPFVETADGVRIYGKTTEPTDLSLVPEDVA